MTCTACDLGTAQAAEQAVAATGGLCGERMKALDPLDECAPNDQGWANLDMDSLTGGGTPRLAIHFDSSEGR